MFHDITDNQWLTFFDVLDRVTNEEGTYKEKAKKLKLIAEEYESDTALEELIDWYSD